MPTETFTHIATVNVASDTSVLTIDSIPGGYADLKLSALIVARTSGATVQDEIMIRFNNNSSTVYDGSSQSSNSGNPDAEGYQNRNAIFPYYSTLMDAGDVTYLDADIFQYRDSSKYTSILGQRGTNQGSETFGAIWKNQSNVTRIDLIDKNTVNDIGAGSTVSIYGIVG